MSIFINSHLLDILNCYTFLYLKIMKLVLLGQMLNEMPFCKLQGFTLVLCGIQVNLLQYNYSYPLSGLDRRALGN